MQTGLFMCFFLFEEAQELRYWYSGGVLGCFYASKMQARD